MQQSFKNGETCQADGQYWCSDHYRTSTVNLKAGDIFPNCKNSWGHGSGTTWINYSPELEEKNSGRKTGWMR